MSENEETLAIKSKRELQHLREEVRGKLRTFKDFPKPGINFM